MLKKLNFEGKTALIVGASRGIGLATAQMLSKYGATVVLTSRSDDKIFDAAALIRKGGNDALHFQCDVTSFASVTSAVEFCIESTDQLDIVVNSAGVIDPLSHLIDSDPELWALAVDVNFKGVYYTMRAAIPQMLKRNDGVVVNISSGAANSVLPGWSHYCSTKAAARKLTEVAQKEFGQSNVCINGLSPGTVATDMMAKIRDSKINAVSNLDWLEHIPPEWAAEAVAFLCGPAGEEFAGDDFSIKTPDGRARVGLPVENAPGAVGIT